MALTSGRKLGPYEILALLRAAGCILPSPVSLNADAPLTPQFLIEDHALRHRWRHLAKIKAVLQGV